MHKFIPPYRSIRHFLAMLSTTQHLILTKIPKSLDGVTPSR